MINVGKDEFNFLDEVMPDHSVRKEEDTPKQENAFSPDEDLVFSSYLLVNALMNILVQKGLIKVDEVTSILGDLHKELKENRRGG